MMGVYIKGMELPTNCCQCPVNMEICKRGYMYLLAHPELYDKRADDCPIVHVPPHGRLIDADAFTKDECNNCDGACEALPCDCLNCEADCRCDFMKDIADAPTVIPAEEGE